MAHVKERSALRDGMPKSRTARGLRLYMDVFRGACVSV